MKYRFKVQSNIPNIIHLVFLKKEETLPLTFKLCLENIRYRCKGWDIRIYDEDDVGYILGQHMPYVLNFYNSFELNIQKADLFRIIVVYIFGGFYMDMDMMCLKSLEDIQQFPIVLAEEKTISEEERINGNLKHRLRVANYMFGSIPKHNFWLYVLQDILVAIKAPLTDNDVLETTGPGLLTNTFHRIRWKFPELILLRNIDRICVRPNHADISCHFGNFAAHLHTGTWRSQLEKTCAKGISNKEQNELIDLFQSKIVDDPNSYNYLSSVLVYMPEKCKAEVNMLALYIKLRTYVKTTHEEPINVHNKIIISLCAYPETGIKARTGNNNKHILFLIDVPADISSQALTEITLLYDLIIVTSEHVKKLLVQSGIRQPIEIVILGFNRLKREFSSNSDHLIESNDFVIGISFKSSRQGIIIKLIEYLKNLRENSIPDLSLSIWQNEPVQYRNSSLPLIILNNNWIKAVSTDKQKWFNSIDYFLSFYEDSELDLEALTSLYLGVPAILFGAEYSIPKNLLHYFRKVDSFMTLTQSQFDKVIKDSYENYLLYANKAIDGAKKIQDKYLIEETYLNLLTLIKKITCPTSFST